MYFYKIITNIFDNLFFSYNISPQKHWLCGNCGHTGTTSVYLCHKSSEILEYFPDLGSHWIKLELSYINPSVYYVSCKFDLDTIDTKFLLITNLGHY